MMVKVISGAFRLILVRKNILVTCLSFQVLDIAINQQVTLKFGVENVYEEERVFELFLGKFHIQTR